MKRTAEINYGSTGGFVVHLFKEYLCEIGMEKDLFGTIDIRDKSIHYANDIVENWANGILGEDNEFISKPS